MLRYATRRLMATVPVLIGATLFVFVAVFALPGDPHTAVAGRAPDSPEHQRAMEARYHLDEPLWKQYGRWVGGLVRGDLGTSSSTRREVSDVVGEALPSTVRLAAGALVIEAVIGVGAGILSAASRRPVERALVATTTTLLIAVPVYVLASSAQYLLGLRWGVLPVSGTDEGLRSWLLPWIVLALPSLAIVARLTQSSSEATRDAGYVETAVAKGLSPSRIMVRHRLRNAIVPVIVFLGLDLAALLSGALFVEAVFNIPGMGLTVMDAIALRDNQLIIGCTLVFVVGFVVLNLVVDLTTAALDPRVRDA